MIDEKIKEAYRMLAAPVPIDSYEIATAVIMLRDWSVQVEARARMAEFKAQHFEIETTRSKPGSREHTCLAMCNYQDPCHNWTLADYEVEVRRELSNVT